MSEPLNVLMVEDSEDDAALLVRELRKGGYDVNFERVDTRSGMEAAVRKMAWDLVICDYSMPHFSGADALKLLRAKDSDIPFIFVSGTIGEDKAVTALKMGAQDYLMKDKLGRLLPAIQRELREVAQRREHKRLEEQVWQLQKFEAIGRLAGGIAHDFNNALGIILGWAQLGCDEEEPGSPARKKFETICGQANHAVGLTRQLLAFARRQVLQPRSISLNQLVLQTMSLLQRVIGENIELKDVLASDLHIIRADPTQIEQVLMNLCLNARDAMPLGGRLVIQTQNMEITEELSALHAHSRPGSYVLLSVSDTGVGMDAITLERIFEPFFTTKERGRGTGLGLATVYGIVKQHEGFINAYSEPGQGTTFHLYFPAGDGAPDARVSAEEEETEGGNETVLLAEDNEGLREVAYESLTRCGYRVILAGNGEEAVHLFTMNAEQIQLLILDVVMPVLGGSEAYSRICAIQPGVPVIFITGHTVEAAQLGAKIEAGAVFLQKPYTPQSLNRIIRSTLNGGKLP